MRLQFGNKYRRRFKWSFMDSWGFLKDLQQPWWGLPVKSENCPDSSRIRSPSGSSDDLQEGSVSKRWSCFLEILNLGQIVLDADLQGPLESNGPC